MLHRVLLDREEKSIHTQKNFMRKFKQGKQPVMEIEEDAIWKKVQAKDNSVVDQLNKNTSQISILTLLQTMENHKKALMRISSEANMSASIIGREMAYMVRWVFES